MFDLECVHDPGRHQQRHARPMLERRQEERACAWRQALWSSMLEEVCIQCWAF